MSADIVVSPFLRLIIRRVVNLDQSTASTYHEELDKIVALLRDLEGVVNYAELNPDDRMVSMEFGWQLPFIQEVLEDVDNLIDEVQMMMMSSNNQQRQLMPTQVSFSLSRFIPFSQQQSKKLATEFQKISCSLTKVQSTLVHYSRFESLDNYKNVRRRRQKGSSLFVDTDTSTIVGRERDETAVIDLILNSVAGRPSSERVSVVPIVGFLGVGKTTLAGLIYTNPRIQDIFDLKLWVDLPIESHDHLYIFRQMLNHLCHLYGPIQDRDRYRDAEQVKTEVHKLLEKKRFLIVLDGFEDINLHKSAVTLVRDMGSRGSAIIVTTRSRRAANSLIGTMPPYQLEPLPEDASYHLLTQFRKGRYQISPEREPVARDAVKLCNGVPSFLVKLSYAVCAQNPLTLEKELQDYGIANFILSDSTICYDLMHECHRYLMLPIQSFHLQKACGISVEALKCVWMALGFLYSDDPTQQPEQVAGKYLREIIESDLWPDVEYAPGGVVRRIKFNDALLDIATLRAQRQWWFTPLSRSCQVHDRYPRYIVWDEDDLSAASKLFYLDKVLLFILCSSRQASSDLVNGIISRFKFLRVLGFGGCNIEMLPDSIGELKHLRYLDVGRNARMKRLPASICDLWHLQTLFLHGCSQLQELPPNIGRLQNLRYLTLTFLMESLPAAIGQLVSLRTLGLSSWPRLASLPRSIKKLKNLQTLGIVNCHVLDLTATSSVEGLKGLDALNTLLLSHLPTFVGLPTDLRNPSVTMKHLMIQSCPSVTETTWVAQFRSLRSLTVEDCPKLQDLTLTDATSHLDGLLELVIRRCPSLGYTAWIRQFMSLRSLIVDGCPKLVELDPGFSDLKNLERLEIRRCPGLSEWFASPAGKDWLRIVHVQVVELDGVHLKS